MSEAPFPLSSEVLAGDTSDVYFLRTNRVMELEGVNPRVAMEAFPSGDGILCGMKEVLALLGKSLPADGEVWGLAEGEPFRSKEIVLRIVAPYLSFGIYETAILGILAHESGWATAARECVEAARGLPIVSFGARHVHPAVAGAMDYAAVVGGCVSCSTPLGARLAGVSPSGTMPHAMILCFGDTVRAAVAFDKHMPPEVPRIVLVDTFHDEPEEALKVAEALGDRLYGVRLDTPGERGGVTPDLVKEARARLDLAGFQHVRIFVSGGVTPARIREFLEVGAPVDSFGVGSYISGASPIDFTADIKEVEGQPVAKRGRIPGVIANPRLQRAI
ncbi:MAG: nicotinate phosphoribosyltransferase [Chloroflexota bacterium]|nr:nicotinate phosphoribosyltransferase [Chloroflexota bacterium]